MSWLRIIAFCVVFMPNLCPILFTLQGTLSVNEHGEQNAHFNAFYYILQARLLKTYSQSFNTPLLLHLSELL